jgi:A/G-specific adenine glycosylase
MPRPPISAPREPADWPPGPVARRLVAWYRRHRRDLPWRRTRDPYRIWVSEVMLQQTTVRVVLPYYRRFLHRFPTLRSLAEARLSAVLAAWSGLGYYRRARHLHAAARLVWRRHGGLFPRRFEEALALPGVGRYTAGAVLSIAYGIPEPVVDGNVERVLSRLLLVRGDPRRRDARERLWGLARALVAAGPPPADLNQALMELGATICSPVSPACPRCPVRSSCAARAAGAQTEIPPPRAARAPVTVRTAVALVTRRGRYLMVRRRGGGLMEGLWEFPALPSRDAGRAPGDPRIRSLGRVATLRHTITYRRFLIEVHRGRLLAEPSGPGLRWVAASALGTLPTSSLVGKIVGACPQTRQDRVGKTPV